MLLLLFVNNLLLLLLLILFTLLEVSSTEGVLSLLPENIPDANNDVVYDSSRRGIKKEN